jgi:hypothetical protein
MAASFFSFSALMWLCLTSLCTCLADLDRRQSCSQGYYLCAPQGASSRDVPEIGPGLARLYLNLVETVNPQPAPANLLERSELANDGSSTGTLEPASLICFSNGKQDIALTSQCSDNGYGCLDLVGDSFLNTMYDTGNAIASCDEHCQCPQPLQYKYSPSEHFELRNEKNLESRQAQSGSGVLCCPYKVNFPRWRHD